MPLILNRKETLILLVGLSSKTGSGEATENSTVVDRNFESQHVCVVQELDAGSERLYLTKVLNLMATS